MTAYRGKYHHWDFYRARAVSSYSGSVSANGPRAEIISETVVYWCDPATQFAGIWLTNIQIINSTGATSDSTARVRMPDLGIDQTFAYGVLQASVQNELILTNPRVYCDGANWYTLFDEINWYVGGVLRNTFGAGNLPNGYLAMTGMPLIGTPPDVTCAGSLAANPVFPRPAGSPAFVSDCSGSNTGGFAVQERGSGVWTSFPIYVKTETPPSGGGSYMPPLPPAPNGSSSDGAVASGGFHYSCSGGDPCISERYAQGGFLDPMPDLPRSVARIGDDYGACVYRGGFPKCDHVGGASWIEDVLLGTGEGTTPLLVTELPQVFDIASRVGNSAHAIEDVLGRQTICPYGYGTQGMKASRSSSGSGDYWRSGQANVDFPNLTFTAHEIWYYTHPNRLATYFNYWGAPHASYVLFFPPEVGPGYTWQVLGADPGPYWVTVRNQYQDHPAFPISERLKTRTTNVSEFLIWGALAGHIHTYIFGNDYTSFWGISRHKVVKPTVPATKAVAAVAAGWTFADCSGIFGAGNVTVTLTGTTCAVELDVCNFVAEPYFLGALAKAVKLQWGTSHVVAVNVYAVNAWGKKRLLTSVSSSTPVTIGDADDDNFAGTWRQDFGASLIADTGFDALPEGKSFETMSDPALLEAFQLFAGRQMDKLRWEVEMDAPALSVTLDMPEFTTATGGVWVHETSNQAALLLPNGPAVRVGSWVWTDGAGNLQPTPGIHAPDHPMGVTDLLCTLNAVFRGIDPATNVATDIAALYDSFEGDDVASCEIERYAFPLPNDSLPDEYRFALVNTNAEMPPCAWFPNFDRDPVTQVESSTYVQKTWSFAFQTRKYPCRTRNLRPFHLFNPVDGLQWTSEAVAPVTGWLLSKHTHVVDNAEPYFEIRHDGTVYAYGRPWPGYFGILGRNSGQSGAVANCHDPWKPYFRAFVQDGKVMLARTDSYRPQPVQVFQATSGPDDKDPAISMTPDRELLLVFERDGLIRQAVSYDDGETFEDKGVVFP